MDATASWEDSEAIAERVVEHHEAGGGRVALPVVPDGEGFPITEHRELGAFGR